MMQVCRDLHLRIPVGVETVRQALDDIEARGIAVDEGNVRAPQLPGADEGREGILAELGATRAYDDDLGWKGHARIVRRIGKTGSAVSKVATGDPTRGRC